MTWPRPRKLFAGPEKHRCQWCGGLDISYRSCQSLGQEFGQKTNVSFLEATHVWLISQIAWFHRFSKVDRNSQKNMFVENVGVLYILQSQSCALSNTLIWRTSEKFLQKRIIILTKQTLSLNFKCVYFKFQCHQKPERCFKVVHPKLDSLQSRSKRAESTGAAPWLGVVYLMGIPKVKWWGHGC